jgi:hypothetical protein
MKRLSLSFAFYFSFAFIVACSSHSPAVDVTPEQAAREASLNPPVLHYLPEAENLQSELQKPYVILISIDGYRYDYNKIFSPPNLTRIAAEGVAAEALQPVYPSKTFPSHYSIVTGMYPEHHGIVSNEFYDPVRRSMYAMGDKPAVEDGTWYLSEPLWNTVFKQGMMTASFFWVGSEADIQGMHPNSYLRYNGSVPNEKRVQQVIEWMKEPVEKRPHFITLYFNDVDSVSHKFGAATKEVGEAIANVDTAIGHLREGLASLNLPVNIIVVSDHGMQDVDPEKVIIIDEKKEIGELLKKFRVVGRGPQMLLYLNTGEALGDVWALKDLLTKNIKHARFLHGNELKRLHYDASPRTGDLVIEADAPYSLGLKNSRPTAKGGNHGWDAARFPIMNGIFYAVGPAFREKTRLPIFENVHVAPLVLEILGLKVPTSMDGRLEVTRRALKVGIKAKKMPNKKADAA